VGLILAIFAICVFYSYALKLPLVKVNLAESVLVLVGCMDNVDGLADILDCGVSSLPLKYLGLPLGACFKAKSIWDGVVEKIVWWLAS
jgi:hypothetical protein